MNKNSYVQNPSDYNLVSSHCRKIHAHKLVDSVQYVWLSFKSIMVDSIVPTPSVLLPRYCLKKVLGAGSYGKVYLAMDLENDTEVAIKLINYSELPQSLKVIQDEEITLLKTIRHPHIVRMIDSYHDRQQNLICTVLPLFPRGDLARFIRHNRETPIPEPQIWWLLAQMGSALRFCTVEATELAEDHSQRR